MATEQNLKPLKILVFSMALVLLGGIILVATLVMKKSISSSPPSYALPVAASCLGGHVDLKGHGEVIDTSMEGNVMRVVFEKESGKSEVVMIDMCSGKVEGTLQVDTDATLVQE